MIGRVQCGSSSILKVTFFGTPCMLSSHFVPNEVEDCASPWQTTLGNCLAQAWIPFEAAYGDAQWTSCRWSRWYQDSPLQCFWVRRLFLSYSLFNSMLESSKLCYSKTRLIPLYIVQTTIDHPGTRWRWQA